MFLVDVMRQAYIPSAGNYIYSVNDEILDNIFTVNDEILDNIISSRSNIIVYFQEYFGEIEQIYNITPINRYITMRDILRCLEQQQDKYDISEQSHRFIEAISSHTYFYNMECVWFLFFCFVFYYETYKTYDVDSYQYTFYKCYCNSKL